MAALVVLLLAFGSAAYAAGPSVAIQQVDGQAVVDGQIADPVKGSTLTVSGAADTAPALVADAGDSSYVQSGTPATLIASAGGGTDPYSYAWSYEGATDRFTKPAEFRSDFDTTGLEGPVTVQLQVTDDRGRTDTDTVQLFVYQLTKTTLLNITAQANAGLLGVNEGDIRHPFTVPADVETTGLDLVLDWNTSYALPGTTPPNEDFGGFNLEVENPEGVEVSEGQGAEFTKPEDVHLEGAVPGEWTAVVVRTLTAPDTYRLNATATSRPHDPVPSVTSGGPYDFQPGQPQILQATTSGGTEPRTTAWDLDYDGVFETADSAEGVTTAFPLGDHLVTVKTTDAAGYERRETTAVRVAVEAPAAPAGLVVVAVSDSGINPYHEDFRATTFSDERILDVTDNFTAHPSTYIPGYPAATEAKNLTFDQPFAAGKFHPAADADLWTKANAPLNKMFWVPGTKIIGLVDTGDSQPINGEPDLVPILDEDGHGTASASVAVGNLYGYCPTCLLAFGENFNSDAFFYKFPWVDLASNSFGSAANFGFAGLVDASHPKANAERGQIALYAAGNGNENAFVTPQQTYTAENLGADWIVRVGANATRDRKPIVGTGKPVDISSWGMGSGAHRLTAASNTTPKGTTEHSGTSAATPYSTGVFGTVLGKVRETFGDGAPGQKNLQAGDGVISRGTPVAGSAYLGDGKLTRAELVETVFKTAQHDTGPTSIGYPVTSPTQNPAQYLMEGYGIVEPESGRRALDVLMGAAALPERPAEDDFFAADSQLRDELWGSWSGGGANSGHPEVASAPAVNPFAGVTAASLTSFDAAYALLSQRAGPFQSDVAADAAAAQAAGGTTFWPHHLGGCVDAADPGSFLDTVNSDGDDDGCGGAGTAGAVGAEVESWTTPASAPVSVTIPEGTAADGFVFIKTWHPSDVLVDVIVSAGGRIVGTSSSELIVVQAPLGTGWVKVPVEFTTASDVVPGDELTISVSMTGAATWFFGYEGDHASFLTFATTGGSEEPPAELAARITSPATGSVVNPAEQPSLPVSGTATFPAEDTTNAVEVSVDDPDFAAPITATFGTDGTWGASIDTTALADGVHTLYARARNVSGVSTPHAVEFTVTRPTPPGPTVVQVQVVPVGDAPADGRWINTADTSEYGDFSSWFGSIDISRLAKGEYQVHARLIRLGEVAALDGPVTFTKKSPARR